MTNRDDLLLSLGVRWADVNGIDLPLDLLIDMGGREAFKSFDFFLRTLQRLVGSLYDGNIGGDFLTIANKLVSTQITRAYESVWAQNGNKGPLPDYLQESATEAIIQQKQFLPQYYQDIVDARTDGTPKGPLMNRTDLWAQRYKEAENEAQHLIDMEAGGKEKWVLGETEDHCPTCAALNGIVAYAQEWEQLGVKPQNAPNDQLKCGGWNCDCSRQPTTQRRSPKAFTTILNIVTAVE